MQRDITTFCKKQVLRKTCSILVDESHILYPVFHAMLLGRCFRCPTCKTNRKKSYSCCRFFFKHKLYIHCPSERNVIAHTGMNKVLLYCTVLYCTVLYCTVLYCTVLYCISSPGTDVLLSLSVFIHFLDCTVLYCTVLYCTVLYCTVLYCTVLYCTVLYCTVLYLLPRHWCPFVSFCVHSLRWLYCTVLYCTVLYCTVLYCTVLYCTVLYCTVLYCTVLYFLPRHWCPFVSFCVHSLPWLYCTVLYCTVLYCTVLYCTVLYCTVLYCTVLYCTVSPPQALMSFCLFLCSFTSLTHCLLIVIRLMYLRKKIFIVKFYFVADFNGWQEWVWLNIVVMIKAFHVCCCQLWHKLNI